MKVQKYQPTLSLRPTQFSAGMLEIEFKVRELKKLRRKKLEKVIRKTAIPVVISPWKELCIVDHHHFLFACWHAHIPEVRIKVIKDYSRSKLGYHQFWKRMTKLGYAYLYDQFGTGPRSALYLPLDIRGLADDPYRSLAWMIRHEGGYENSTEPFAEFAWADLFRGRRLLAPEGRRGFHSAIKRGLRLARSRAARQLPGYSSPKGNQVLDGKARAGKSKYVPEEQKKGPAPTRIAVNK